MTQPNFERRPQELAKDFEFLRVKEAARMLAVSHWTIYKLIESDKNFPAHNVGVKKKFIVNKKDLLTWLEAKTKRRALEKQELPSGQDLLKIKGDK